MFRRKFSIEMSFLLRVVQTYQLNYSVQQVPVARVFCLNLLEYITCMSVADLLVLNVLQLHICGESRVLLYASHNCIYGYDSKSWIAYAS